MSDATNVSERGYPAKVVSVMNTYLIVINRGTQDKVHDGDEFLLYELGDEIDDPDTGEPLGRLEIPKGTGEVVHAQEQMATIQSNVFAPPTRRVIRQGGRTLGYEEEIVPSTKRLAFTRPAVGDYVKPV